jgi:uncharacterized membrane protein YbhN (UPF0104 family)|tara:strand:- start:159 stop:1190 length:1032 start_codon:yes stop_codon:yes gene_type:complete
MTSSKFQPIGTNLEHRFLGLRLALKSFDSKKVIRLMQLLLAVGLLVLVWRLVEGEQVLEMLGSANPSWLIASLAVISLQTVLSALRWRLTAGQLGLSFSRGTALREYYLAQIANQALPGGILGDAGRALRSRAPAGLFTSGQAVVLERLAGQVAVFLLMLIALFVTQLIPVAVDWPSWLLLTVGLILISLSAISAVLIWIARNSMGKTGRLLKGLAVSSRLAFSPSRVLWRQVLLSLGTALCNVAGFTFAAWAVGFELLFLDALAVVPMILLAILLPITVSGWGLREGVAVALFPIVGATATQGLAASMAFGLTFLAAALPGLAFVRSARQPKAEAQDLGSLE